MNPSSTAFASVIVITGTTIVRRMREPNWRGHIMEIVVFGFVLLIALLTLAIVLPSAAIILGWLGMVGAFAVNGPAVFSLLGSFGQSKKAA